MVIRTPHWEYGGLCGDCASGVSRCYVDRRSISFITIYRAGWALLSSAWREVATRPKENTLVERVGEGVPYFDRDWNLWEFQKSVD